MRIKSITLWIGCVVAGLSLMYMGGHMGAKRSIPVNLLGFRGEAVSSLFQQSTVEPFNRLENNDLSAFDHVNIHVTNARVSVEESDRFGLEIGYYDDRPIQWETVNGLLSVTDRSWQTTRIIMPFGSFSDGRNAYVKVYCPADALEDVNVETVSGRITVSGLRTNSLNVETVSGAIDLQECVVDWMNLETVSGRIEARDCAAVQINTETISGRIALAGVTGDDVMLSTVSGRISYETDRAVTQYGIRLSSVSGALEINGDRVGKKEYVHVGHAAAPYSLTATSVSGRIDLRFAS